MHDEPRQLMNTRKHSGFTLVELLMALSISGMIGLGVVLMLGSTGQAVKETRDTRQATVSRQVVIARLGSLLRSSAMVLAKEDHAIVLWKGDANANGQPDLSELRRITWDEITGSITQYQSPESLDEGSDIACELSDDFAALTQSLQGQVIFPGQLVLQHAQSWTLTLDAASPHDARLVKLEVGFNFPSGQDKAVVIAALRASGM